MGIFFDKLNESLILVNLEYDFKKKGIVTTECKYLVKESGRIVIKVKTKNDTILIEKTDAITWKLNGLDKGKILGESIHQVVGDYEYQIALRDDKSYKPKKRFRDYYREKKNEQNSKKD